MTARRIGVISDTHGLLRAEAIEALSGSELILHAGDIGNAQILEELRAMVAPVIAVRGNNDKGVWAKAIHEREVVVIDSISIYMLHDVKELKSDVSKEDFQIVVSGHSHKPLVKERSGVLFLNPGSAGPRRFNLPISVATLTIERGKAAARIIDLSP
jgi:putative phosphoesterase